MSATGPVGSSDPYYANVVLLLHSDGTNGSTTFTDNSPSPKTVTAFDNAQISTSVFKYGTGSAKFDGTGDYLSTPSTTAFDLGDTYTVEFWVNPTSVTGGWSGWLQRGYYSTFDTSWTGLVFSIRVLDSTIYTYLYGTTSANQQVIQTAPSVIVAGSWQFYTLVRNGTTAKVYINGVEKGTMSGLNSPAVSARPLVIGDWDFYNAGPAHEYFNGYIDDIRITKGVARYLADFTPPTAAFPDSAPVVTDPYFANVSVLLHGDGTNGSTAIVDSSSNSAAITVNAPAAISTAQSKFGGSSMLFTDVASVNYTIPTAFYSSDFTVEAWVYASSWAGGEGLIFTNATSHSIGLYPTTSPNFLLRYYGDNYPYATIALFHQTLIAPGAWYHVAACKASNVVSLYINGIKSTTTDTEAHVLNIAGTTITTGKFPGYVDDLRITAGVARYSANFTPPTAPFPNS